MKRRKMTKNNSGFSKYIMSLLLFLLFEAVAVTLWLTKDNLFYLLNFSYIGCCLALGTALFTAGKRYARHFVQLAVGCYMLLYLGVISRENMQIEGFWYYLSSAFLKRRLSTMLWRKFSVPYFSGAAGADTPAGRQWCWIFFPTSSRRNRGKKNSEYCVM